LIVNNLGTLLYSLIFGRKVGQDINGNKFFIHRKRPGKKWVLYKNELDPTLLEVDWQMWLLNKNSLDIPKSEKKIYKWQKEREKNFSGTSKSYHPKINKKNNKNYKNKEEIWSP
jgi:NADH:ubiquinone oxidoreductase subunit